MISTDPYLNTFPDESLSVIQMVNHPLLLSKGIKLDVKREDLMHPYISGNKWRKLKYNLVKANKEQKDTLLTFGGAHSNHIYATAAAGKIAGFKTIGIIRGDELSTDNQTLKFSEACGMNLQFISREEYRNKNETEYIHTLKKRFGDFYLIPEGGTNEEAIKGCREILSDNEFDTYDFITLAIGTGGTFIGILDSSVGKSHLLGTSSLKGEFMYEEINSLKEKYGIATSKNYSVLTQYHHGGYGKSSSALNQFISDFQSVTQIPIEFVYTGKLFYAIFDLIAKDHFKPGTKILAIHTGGLRNAPAGFAL